MKKYEIKFVCKFTQLKGRKKGDIIGDRKPEILPILHGGIILFVEIVSMYFHSYICGIHSIGLPKISVYWEMP